MILLVATGVFLACNIGFLMYLLVRTPKLNMPLTAAETLKAAPAFKANALRKPLALCYAELASDLSGRWSGDLFPLRHSEVELGRFYMNAPQSLHGRFGIIYKFHEFKVLRADHAMPKQSIEIDNLFPVLATEQ
jgi:hypothetical protein